MSRSARTRKEGGGTSCRRTGWSLVISVVVDWGDMCRGAIAEGLHKALDKEQRELLGVIAAAARHRHMLGPQHSAHKREEAAQVAHSHWCSRRQIPQPRCTG